MGVYLFGSSKPARVKMRQPVYTTRSPAWLILWLKKFLLKYSLDISCFDLCWLTSFFLICTTEKGLVPSSHPQIQTAEYFACSPRSLIQILKTTTDSVVPHHRNLWDRNGFFKTGEHPCPLSIRKCKHFNTGGNQVGQGMLFLVSLVSLLSIPRNVLQEHPFHGFPGTEVKMIDLYFSCSPSCPFCRWKNH